MGESLWAAVSPSYLLSPDWRRAHDQRRVVPAIAVLLGIGLTGAFVVSLLGPLATEAGFESTLAEELDDLSLAVQALTVVLLAPLAEEFLYRMVLNERLYFKWLGHLGLLSLICVLITLLSPPALLYTPLLVLAAVAFAILRGIQLSSAPELGDRFMNWWAQHPRVPVYASIAVFAAAHLSNFDVDWSPLAVAAIPVAVAPQLWLGLTFTIARVRYGWLSAVALHAVHNSIIWAIASALTE